MNLTPYVLKNALDALSGVNSISDPHLWTFHGNAYVESRRNGQWADIVALARFDTTGENSCGFTQAQHHVLASSSTDYPLEPGPTFERYAYLVFNPGCNPDRLNLAHELGHLLGMEHDATNSQVHVGNHPGMFPSCPWSYGHRQGKRPGFNDPRFAFRTIMAYRTSALGPNPTISMPPCLDIDCPQIDAYSNPALEWDGDGSMGTGPFGVNPVGTVVGAAPIGLSAVNVQLRRTNANDTLRRLAPIVEAFRARPDAIFANGFQ